MKAVFLNPPFKKFYNRVVRWQAVTNQGALHPPIWLLYQATMTKQSGHKVDFIDAIAENLDYQKTIDRIGDADVVVMETAASSFNNDVRFAKMIKEQRPDIKIAMSGPQVTAMPKFSMKEPIDAVIFGEADLTTKEYVDSLNQANKSDILGLVWRNGNEIVQNKPRPLIEDLDSIPVPDRSLLPMDKYSDSMFPSPFSFYYTMRGCAYKCIYCLWTHTIYRQRLRFRSPRLAAEEVLNDIKKLKLKCFYINDECFTVNKKHLMEFCRELGDPGIRWGCYFRSDNIDEEMCKRLKDSGCEIIRTSPEVGTNEGLKVINKGGTASMENDIKAFKLAKKYGFEIYASFVLGHPGETKETIKKTVEHAIELEPDTAQFAILQPLPGTPFYNYLKEKGYLLTENFDDYLNEAGSTKAVFEYPWLSHEDLVNGWHYCWRKFYMRPKFILRTGLRLLKHPKFIVPTISAYMNMRKSSLSKKVEW
ncbi:MAG: cobalamin-dependent protein [Candidatus Aenigmarchaeota archaeon]|nr:cobalamin-dependent protein [Candidatus Aenigmarchaeota archaeon]